jgi:hypothetical protein
VAIKKGQRNEIPIKFVNSTNPADQAMLKAIDMAWTLNPDDRPPAMEIARFMKKALEKLDGARKGDELWRVSIPPLPPNHRYTDSEFYANLMLE